ncbi:hypothetical protein [Natronospora cellulosivora (SeqCode)]
MTIIEKYITEALNKATNKYDPDEHGNYIVFVDPVFRKLNEGEIEKAGFSDAKEAFLDIIYRIALSGPMKPHQKSMESVKDIFTESAFYTEIISQDLKNTFSQRYYRDDEEKYIFKYNGLEQKVYTYRISGNMWRYFVRIKDFSSGNEAYIVLGDNKSENIL